MRSERELIELDEYHRPKLCAACGGVMVFKGVGEYQCEDCKSVAYDDYGKVRLYIESHRGATAPEIEAATGVKQRTIRNMLKEGRLEVAPDSKSFLHCEMCGKAIRYGRLCQECELNYHRHLEEKQRQERRNAIHGFGLEIEESSGEKRFRWER